MQNNDSTPNNFTSISPSKTKVLARFKERVQEQARAVEQRQLSASIERKVEANPWTKGTIHSLNKDKGRFGERRDRSFGEDRSERHERFGERRERGFGEDRSERRGFGERKGRWEDRAERGFGRGSYAERIDSANLYDVAGDFDSGSERPERKVVDARSIYECEVPIGRLVELEICELNEKGAFVDAKDHGPLFIPRSQLSDEVKEGDLVRVFLYKDGERTLATARRPYIELGMTGNLRINSVKNGTAYLDLGIPKELVLPVSEQRFRMYEDDNALVLVCIDNLGRLFGTQCFNRYIRDKAMPHEFEDNQRVKIVAVAHTPLGFRVIVDDKVYGLIYESEQKGELIIGKRYDGFVKTVRPDGRLDISLQEAGRDGVEHASLDILQALYFSNGQFDFNDKSDPKTIEDYLKMSKGRFKKALGALYKQRLVDITDSGVVLTEGGQKLAKERFAHLKVKDQVLENESESSSYDDIEALANVDACSDQDPLVDAVVSAVAQARKEGKIQGAPFYNQEVKSYQNTDVVSEQPQDSSDMSAISNESTSWGENLDDLGDFAGRRSAVNQMSGYGQERKSFGDDRRKERRDRDFGDRRRERGDRDSSSSRFGDRRERGDRDSRSSRFGDRRDRGFGERRERSFGQERDERRGGRFDRDSRGFGERSSRPSRFSDRKERRDSSERSSRYDRDSRFDRGSRSSRGERSGFKSFRGKR